MTGRLSLVDGGAAMHASVTSPRDVASQLGLHDGSGTRSSNGHLPFELHSHLTASPRFAPDDFEISTFRAAGHDFHWIEAVRSEDVWRRIALEGQVLAPSRSRRDFLRLALVELAGEPGTIEFVRRFVTTFVPVAAESGHGGGSSLTSCSLPDFPLAVFISDLARRHIPPLTVSPEPSPLLMAENIHHEAVHQYVNYRLLVDDFFPVDYDARTSPRVDIPWRRGASERNAAWQLDRVLHAATVYVQVLRWRMNRLRSSQLTRLERQALRDASTMAATSCSFLVGALTEHVESFTPQGALFVGRLSLAAEEQGARAHAVLGAQIAMDAS